ncbi:hypothetical protein ESCO_005903 [Escovopsis weberi]|uniref:Uncharacterized protein n=1 Tax=Escovopsis weberi TaxID=150374 RepID=A0A0M9VS07_ESCWE|nr:hypothetical protein ESCO_005903 [Escovopsis weberi]
MNTVKSFWVGWGSLCVAGAGAYYFAKKEINRDRHAKLEAQRQRKDEQYAIQMQYSDAASAGNGLNGGPARTDTAGSPSQEAGSDPASTRHAPATESQQIFEKSKYESSTPFRSRKGDRFS